MNNHLEQGPLPENQCGVRHYRGTTDMIFAARKLQEKCQEMRTHLYSTVVGLTKAFDTVNREGPRKIMQKLGCPELITHMLRQLHGGASNRHWICLRGIRSDQRSGAGLRPRAHSLRSHVLFHADGRLP
ncbi:hypothetical protein SprV_0200841400 [Sparganum proliferum]